MSRSSLKILIFGVDVKSTDSIRNQLRAQGIDADSLTISNTRTSDTAIRRIVDSKNWDGLIVDNSVRQDDEWFERVMNIVNNSKSKISLIQSKGPNDVQNAIERHFNVKLVGSQTSSFVTAANNLKQKQHQTTFEIIEPLFYTEFNKEDPIFDDWTIERVPRSFNAKRILWDGYKMSRGWLYESYNTKGRFRCIKCITAGVSEDDATWSSAYTTFLFRAYYGPDTDENGQIWIGGWIQMKSFAQQCKNCGEHITAELDDKRPQYLVRWLHRWIANKFYDFPFHRPNYRGIEIDLNHLENRCEACQTGWCYYLKLKSRYANRRRN